jgi:PEP-CTERM motif
LRKLCAVLTLLSAMAIPVAAHADEIDGPVTIGTGAPIGSGASFGSGISPTSLGYGEYVLPLFTNSFSVFGDDAGTFASQTITFAFDLAPGWTMGLGPSYDGIEGGTTQSHYDEGDWSFEFEQEVILCPSSATSACSGNYVTSTGGQGGPSPLPPLTLNAVAEPGTGVFEWEGYARNYDFGIEPGDGGFKIYLEQQPAATPEPSTLVLLGTGAIGLLSAVKRRPSRT